ncbi:MULTISPECIES: UMP kinase [Bacillus]|uniref:UMP kinase n=1 Tax=Bacillus TaxID=1386 RepID=UPI0020CC8805|nr:UMP kinase [Bacillus safensis]MCP9282885.1 UMP kinase [Bacillus safensis]
MSKRYNRILIKLSGGAISGSQDQGFDHHSLEHIANEVLSIVELGIEVSLVVGGGNIFRGNLADVWGIDRVEADNIGTLGTVINSLMLRGVLKSKTSKQVRVMTSIPITTVAEPYIRLKAVNHLDKGYIVIFAGGNGQPFVTTDYPAAQRALETNSDAILVAKQGISGVYNSDPNINKDAKKYKKLHYDDVIKEDLRVMDQSALLLARDHNIPVHVFDFNQKGFMKSICEGKDVGTLVCNEPSTFSL